MSIDELLLEWSYKCEKGYPEIDNPSDMLILESILKELDIPVEGVLNKLENVKGGEEDEEDEKEDSLEPNPEQEEKELADYIDQISCPIDQKIAKLIATSDLDFSDKIQKINRILSGFSFFSKQVSVTCLKRFLNH